MISQSQDLLADELRARALGPLPDGVRMAWATAKDLKHLIVGLGVPPGRIVRTDSGMRAFWLRGEDLDVLQDRLKRAIIQAQADGDEIHVVVSAAPTRTSPEPSGAQPGASERFEYTVLVGLGDPDDRVLAATTTPATAAS